ncbi:MAG: Tad domain-containing protein [Deltaproteobacteria bacterium]|nr:Tad domain-containing protein [Deltaproteobacteria bacterium]
MADLHRDEGGQAIVFIALTLLIVVAFVMLVINTGVAVSGKVQMMNAADSSVISGATWMARGFNTAAIMNKTQSYLLATILLTESMNRTHQIASYLVYGMFVGARILEKSGWTALAGFALEGLAQTNYFILFGGFRASKKDFVSLTYDLSLDGLYSNVLSPLRGTMWNLMGYISEANDLLPEVIPWLAQLESVVIGQENGANLSFVLPLIPDVDYSENSCAENSLCLPIVPSPKFDALCEPTLKGLYNEWISGSPDASPQDQKDNIYHFPSTHEAAGEYGHDIYSQENKHKFADYGSVDELKKYTPYKFIPLLEYLPPLLAAINRVAVAELASDLCSGVEMPALEIDFETTLVGNDCLKFGQSGEGGITNPYDGNEDIKYNYINYRWRTVPGKSGTPFVDDMYSAGACPSGACSSPRSYHYTDNLDFGFKNLVGDICEDDPAYLGEGGFYGQIRLQNKNIARYRTVSEGIKESDLKNNADDVFDVMGSREEIESKYETQGGGTIVEECQCLYDPKSFIQDSDGGYVKIEDGKPIFGIEQSEKHYPGNPGVYNTRGDSLPYHSYYIKDPKDKNGKNKCNDQEDDEKPDGDCPCYHVAYERRTGGECCFTEDRDGNRTYERGQPDRFYVMRVLQSCSFRGNADVEKLMEMSKDLAMNSMPDIADDLAKAVDGEFDCKVMRELAQGLEGSGKNPFADLDPDPFQHSSVGDRTPGRLAEHCNIMASHSRFKDGQMLLKQLDWLPSGDSVVWKNHLDFTGVAYKLPEKAFLSFKERSTFSTQTIGILGYGAAQLYIPEGVPQNLFSQEWRVRMVPVQLDFISEDIGRDFAGNMQSVQDEIETQGLDGGMDTSIEPEESLLSLLETLEESANQWLIHH